MIIEHAHLRVSDGRDAEFEESMTRALAIIESAPHCHGAEVRRQVESPAQYLLIVHWTSIEAHQTFRTTPLFEQWRALTHHFYAEPPAVHHYSDPLQR